MRFVAAYIVVLGACHASNPSETVDLGPAPGSAATAVTAVKRSEPINPRLLRRFRPLQPAVDEEPARISLGRQLFFDPRLSHGGETSCHSCHALERGGAEQRPVSIGVGGRKGTRNAPTVFNAAAHVAQFWDGREPDVERQAASPILNPTEMAMKSAEDVTAVLRSIPGYEAPFTTAFGPDAVDFAHATMAIGAFERTLRTPSRWDAYLEGDSHALTAKELEGLKVFSDVGCIQCHTGELVGGSMFQKAGAVEAWPNQRDQGRFEITRVEADRMVFKVPSLRNVFLTAPYFHDGSVKDLADAVTMMAKHQLGTELTTAETTAIVAWLGSLTGTQPAIEMPALPVDGPTTAALVSAH